MDLYDIDCSANSAFIAFKSEIVVLSVYNGLYY